MSVSNEVLEQTAAADTGASAVSVWLDRIDVVLERMGDWLNPILVKETRQALKSRQFTATFWLLLLFGAGWSFVGVTMSLPHVYYLPSGPMMLIGYFIILCIPLLLVVPFSAYRSLAMEKEDGTYELLSITTLSARQIVTGKLGSALMQMLVYYAALAPCIAFTYLLRGLDFGIVLIVLVGTFLSSVLLSAVGLVSAGMQRSKQWQALSSVLLLLLLMIVGWMWTFSMSALIAEGRSALNTREFWYGVGMYVTMYSTFLALLILVAAAQNGFVTDNHSTRIRVTLLVQTLLYFGWMYFLWSTFEAGEFGLITLCFAGVAWAIYGTILTGETAELSPRAQRDLPQTFMGRMFLTWFNPGSATGYVFTLNTFGMLVLAVFVVDFSARARGSSMGYDHRGLYAMGMLMWAYMAFYLGLGRLIIAGLRRVSEFGTAAVVLIHLLVLIAAAAMPFFLQFWLSGYREPRYGPLQAMNWWWSIIESVNRRSTSMPFTLMVAGLAGLSMYVLTLVLAAREVEATRLVAPTRVLEDDAQAESA